MKCLTYYEKFNSSFSVSEKVYINFDIILVYFMLDKNLFYRSFVNVSKIQANSQVYMFLQ